jgi:hypothetical protein
VSETQAYTYYAWIDGENFIREGGICPTASLADHQNWERGDWRYVEHDLPELVSNETHYVDTDGTIKRRDLPTARTLGQIDMPPPRRN